MLPPALTGGGYPVQANAGFPGDTNQQSQEFLPGMIGRVDAGEKRFVHEVGLEVFDMRYIDEMGMRHAMELALATLDAHTHLHVSFDVDFLDPSIAPGVDTTVPGGPTYREAQLCMEMIADTQRLRYDIGRAAHVVSNHHFCLQRFNLHLC